MLALLVGLLGTGADTRNVGKHVLQAVPHMLTAAASPAFALRQPWIGRAIPGTLFEMREALHRRLWA